MNEPTNNTDVLSQENSEIPLSLDRITLEDDLLGPSSTVEHFQKEFGLSRSNFELQSRAVSAEGQLEEMKAEYKELKSQLKSMTIKNTELFKLLASKETYSAETHRELEMYKNDNKILNEKYGVLIQSSQESEDTTKRVKRENQLMTDEIRVLRLEMEQLKQKNSELSVKSTVELETVEEQLRLRKEKQYQLLGKLQSQEETFRQAEERVKELEDTVRALRQKSSEVQTNLQLETNTRVSQDNAYRILTLEFQSVSAENKEIKSKLLELENDRLKLQSESRDNAEQLREMAEKVFQLLERLKLSELGKKKSMESLTKKEHELFALKKQQNKAAEDIMGIKRAREKVQAEKDTLEDQLRGLKKVNSQLVHKLKEEAKARIREEELCKEANEKVVTLDGRIAFLLNRLQTDEEAKSVQQEEMKKMEIHMQSTIQKCDLLQIKLTETEESLRGANVKLHESDKMLNEASIKLESLEDKLKLQENESFEAERKAFQSKEKTDKNIVGGNARFYVDNRPSLGHLVITGKNPKDKVWIEGKGCNIYLRKALKGQNVQESLVKRIAELYGEIVFGEEKLEIAQNEFKSRNADIDRLDREINKMQAFICSEEESKRRILLKYLRAVKASVSLGEPGCEEDRTEVGSPGAGRLHLDESSLDDEDVHAIVAMLRQNLTIEELHLRKNKISDVGARAIASILAERSAIKYVDLRENNVSMFGIKAIVVALENAQRVRKVIVHPGGKIEAMGSAEAVTESEATTLAVTTVCVVDLRDNKLIDTE